MCYKKFPNAAKLRTTSQPDAGFAATPGLHPCAMLLHVHPTLTCRLCRDRFGGTLHLDAAGSYPLAQLPHLSCNPSRLLLSLLPDGTSPLQQAIGALPKLRHRVQPT